MGEEVVRTDEDLPMLATHGIVEIAQEAEKRIDAIIKIKQIALKVTNTEDWTNQQDRPYLQVSGAEKVANLFSISWQIDEPRLDFEDDGHFTYTYKGKFSLGGRSIEVDGSRSSKDPFFKKYDWKDGVKTEKPISDIDKRDVKMAAMTNLLGNGITRILGIRNLSWEDLLEFAKIKKENVKGIEYKTKGEKPPLKEPQKKANGQDQTQGGIINPIIQTQIIGHKEWPPKKDGGNPTYQIFGHIEGNEQSFTSFSKTVFDLAVSETGTGTLLRLEYTPKVVGGKTYLNIVSLNRIDEPGPQENAQ